TRKTNAKKDAESRYMIVSELMEQVRDTYWRVEEKGDVEQTNSFMRELSLGIESGLLNNRR
ncbi:6754_t:CDS:1, partial [Gigaspora rosea]